MPLSWLPTILDPVCPLSLLSSRLPLSPCHLPRESPFPCRHLPPVFFIAIFLKTQIWPCYSPTLKCSSHLPFAHRTLSQTLTTGVSGAHPEPLPYTIPAGSERSKSKSYLPCSSFVWNSLLPDCMACSS